MAAAYGLRGIIALRQVQGRFELAAARARW